MLRMTIILKANQNRLILTFSTLYLIYPKLAQEQWHAYYLEFELVACNAFIFIYEKRERIGDPLQFGKKAKKTVEQFYHTKSAFLIFKITTTNQNDAARNKTALYTKEMRTTRQHYTGNLVEKKFSALGDDYKPMLVAMFVDCAGT